ncbi:MAG: LUD domain-containing protein [Lentimicrobiaceae bacterium]|nr:LUD domain-containing protein [Lentimicrobiaceae bacterium]
MEESTSKEKVLKKIRNALIYKSDNPFPKTDFDSEIYQPMDDAPEIIFAEELTLAGGNFIYCENESDLIMQLRLFSEEKNWQPIFCLDEALQELLTFAKIPYTFEDKDFHDLKTACTRCEYLIARHGSVMVSSKHTSGRRLNVFPENHVVIAYTSQILPDLKQALITIKNKYNGNLPSFISVITGPSRTADIEKTLVMGAHGPRDLYVFLVEDNE